MPNEWIIDVLEDLRNFADANTLPDLAQHLHASIKVAERELSAHETPRVSLIHASFAGEADFIGPIRRHS